MKPEPNEFLAEHRHVTRRYFLRLGSAGVAAMSALPLFAAKGTAAEAATDGDALQGAIKKLPTWLTRQDDFGDVSRGDPKPHSLDEEKRKQVGLTRDTWRLEVIDDAENTSGMRRSFKKEDDTAFKFDDLMKLAKTHAVRFPKVMTCLNMGYPLGNGIWEGVPLRELLWLTEPREKLRRVFYHGYHNDKPEQMFRSSLPVGRILEDTFGLPPVILCYKLNGEWLTPERGAPVRMVVPEAYGFKSIKWLSQITLSNIWKSNDTYGERNNDVDSPLKTFCEAFSLPAQIEPEQPLAVTGYAQVGISSLKKVQVWIQNNEEDLPSGDRYFTKAPWQDAAILPPPNAWGGDIADNRIPKGTHEFDDETRRPKLWPIRLTKAHWAILLPGLPAGEYTLRCRTIDENGAAQPMPRPFRKSGRAAIQEMQLKVEYTADVPTKEPRR